jgi:hypothetical protein
MTDVGKILEMIENADPSDRKTLDEIDARVHCYLQNCTYGHGGITIPAGWTRGDIWVEQPNTQFGGQNISAGPNYCSSRDALKQIRPEGWGVMVRQSAPDKVDCFIHRFDLSVGNRNAQNMPTEELAELHAIIQALDHARNASKGG